MPNNNVRKREAEILGGHFQTTRDPADARHREEKRPLAGESATIDEPKR
jgi:hypothetical protein